MDVKKMAKAMHTALSKADVKAIQQLVDQGFPLDERVYDGKNRTALHVAVDLSSKKGVALLLELGANPDIQTDQFEATALYMACEEGDLPVATLLLDAGADVSIAQEYGHTPIMAAAQAPKNAKPLVELLLSHGATVAPNEVGRNPLHAAITDPALVDLLVDAGADINGSFHGLTPLMCSMTNIFLCKADPASKSYNKPQPKVVAALVAHGADPNARFPREMRFGADAKEQTIADYARQKKLSASILQILESAKPAKPTKKGTTPKKKATPTNKAATTKKATPASKKAAQKKTAKKKPVKTKTATKKTRSEV